MLMNLQWRRIPNLFFKVIRGSFKYITDRDYRWKLNTKLGLNNRLSDEEFLSRQFEIMMGYPIDFDNVRTFSEKMTWLKLNDHDARYINLVDKKAVKEIAAEKLGDAYVTPLLGVWEKAEDIDFAELPEQFVLKCTHDSHSVQICRDRAVFDEKTAVKKLHKALKRNYYFRFREWPYQAVKPRVIAEELLQNQDGSEVMEYKLMMFEGKVRFVIVCSGREQGTLRCDYFDPEFQQLEIQDHYSHSEKKIEKPVCWDQMVEMAEKLAEDFILVRIDFYLVDDIPRFGEYTFYDCAGYVHYEPEDWNLKIGSWVHLPCEDKV